MIRPLRQLHHRIATALWWLPLLILFATLRLYLS